MPKVLGICFLGPNKEPIITAMAHSVGENADDILMELYAAVDCFNYGPTRSFYLTDFGAYRIWGVETPFYHKVLIITTDDITKAEVNHTLTAATEICIGAIMNPFYRRPLDANAITVMDDAVHTLVDQLMT